MAPAFTLASMASTPSDGPTVLLCRTVTLSGRAPPLIRPARSAADAWVNEPLISVRPPWMPTLHCTVSTGGGEEMTLPSSTIATRRLGSPDGLQAAAPVMVSHCRPPSPWKVIETET